MRIAPSRVARRLTGSGKRGQGRLRAHGELRSAPELAFLHRAGQFVTLGVSIVAMGVTVGMALGANGGQLGSQAKPVACVSPSSVDVGCRAGSRPGSRPGPAPHRFRELRVPSPAATFAPDPVAGSTEAPARTSLTVSESQSATVGTGGADAGSTGTSSSGTTGSRATPGLRSSVHQPLFTLRNLAAAKTVSRCITVTYVGPAPARVRLYAPRSGTGLDAYLNVAVVRGQMHPSSGTGCAGFRPDAREYAGAGPGVLFRGRLSGFPRTATAGGAATAPAWKSGESHTYRIVVSVASVRAAEGRSVRFDFVWKALT